MAIGESGYLEQRLDDQIIWYDRKSAASQAAYKRLRLIEIVAAAAEQAERGLATGQIP